MDKRLLVGITAKIDRAEQHLRHLDCKVPAWIAKQQPYTAEHYADPGKGLWITTLVLSDAPVDFSVIFGEAIHNLRSALDQLVCRLVETEGGKPTTSTAFPILHTRGQWQSRIERRQRWYQAWCKRPRGNPLGALKVGGPAWTLIERHQPYRRGKEAKNHPLFTLENLWNRDKHRTLNPFFLEFSVDGPAFLNQIRWHPPIEPVYARCPFKAGDRAESGTKLFVARFPAPMQVVKMEDMRLPVRPVFGEGEGQSYVFDTLRYIRDLVAEATSL